MSEPGVFNASAATWCCELELSGAGGLRGVVERHAEHRRVRVLVRLHGDPLGYVTIDAAADGPTSDEVELEAVLRFASSRFLRRVNEHLRTERHEQMSSLALTNRPPIANRGCSHHAVADGSVSVIVCTRNRSSILGPCLERLEKVDYPDLEFIIVDNAPSDASTRDLVEAFSRRDGRFRYVLEAEPGLSRARNQGLAHATGRYVAYTDDDVAVDTDWVSGLVRGFRRREDVGCVTGLVCTANITNAYEAFFDARMASWSTRCEPEFFDLRGQVKRDALYPYSAGIFGTGASFAFDRELLDAIGGFDVALGAGTKTRGGEDLDIFVRVLREGRAIAYEPSAVVWHNHRANEAALLKQMFGYGTGFSAYLAKLLMSGETRGAVLRQVPRGVARLLGASAETKTRLGTQVPVPRGAMWRERLGFLLGPALYFLARRNSHRTAADTRVLVHR